MLRLSLFSDTNHDHNCAHLWGPDGVCPPQLYGRIHKWRSHVFPTIVTPTLNQHLAEESTQCLVAEQVEII
jgi:hypothetical protein